MPSTFNEKDPHASNIKTKNPGVEVDEGTKTRMGGKSTFLLCLLHHHQAVVTSSAPYLPTSSIPKPTKPLK